jgi:Protein of unknown function (DUF3800)
MLLKPAATTRGKIRYPLDSQPDLEACFVGRLAQSLYPLNPCGRPFVFLTAYYDESGTHAGSLATVLAGFVGNVNDWVDFEIEWNKIIQKHNIPFLRAKQFFHRQGPYRNWSRDQMEHLWADMMYILQERKHIFASKTVLRDDNYKMFYVSDGPNGKERLDTRYALCFRAFLHFLAQTHFQHHSGAINFVLEQGHSNGNDALRVFQEIKADKSLRWRETIGSLSFGEKRQSGALQIADMLAYLSYRMACEAIEDGLSDQSYVSDFEFDLVEACGLTILEHLIEPNDMMNLRRNYLRKQKLPVFEKARIDVKNYTVTPASYEARYAGLRAP